jgi:hypothetical protein
MGPGSAAQEEMGATVRLAAMRETRKRRSQFIVSSLVRSDETGIEK